MLVFISSVVGFRAVWWILAIKRKWSSQMWALGEEGTQGRDGGRSYQDFLFGDLGKITGNTKWMWVMMFERVKPKAEGMAEFCCFAPALSKARGWISWRNLPGYIPSSGIHLLGSLENGADPAAVLRQPHSTCGAFPSLWGCSQFLTLCSHFHLSQMCNRKLQKKKK